MLTNMFRDSLFAFLSLCVMFCEGKVLKIAWMVPGAGSSHSINSGTSGGAMAVALSALSKNSNILRGHTIDMKMFNTKCDSQSGMMSAMTAQNTYNPDVFIGPPCTNAMKSVARYGNYYNIPVFSWYNPDGEFDDYPNLIRMHPPMKSLAKTLQYALNEMGQTQVSLLYEKKPPYSTLKDSVEAELQTSSIRIIYSGSYSSTMAVNAVDQLMMTIKNFKGAVVFMMSADGVRRCMLSVVRTGTVTDNFKYIHLDPQIYKDTELKTSVLSDGYWRRGDASDKTAMRVYSKLTHIILDSMNDDHDPTLADPRSRYTDFYHLTKTVTVSNYSSFKIPSNGQPDVYSLYLYDCVSVWSVLADQMLKENRSIVDAKIMTQRSKTCKAEGSTGYISLDNSADRTAKVFLLGMAGGGAFRSRKILKFDKTGSYKAIVVKRAVSQSGRPGGGPYPLSGLQSALSKMNSPVKLPLKPTSGVSGSYLNEMKNIQQTATNAVNSGNPLTVIMNRLARLEKAVTKALNHDHTRDHPPHERLQAHYHAPNTIPHPHPNSKPTTSIKKTARGGRKRKLSKAVGVSGKKAKTTTTNTAETLATELINQLSGVLNKTISSLPPGGAAQGQQEANTTPPPKANVNAVQQMGGEQQAGENHRAAMHQDYLDAIARIKEEIPQEMHPFIDFGGYSPLYPAYPTSPPLPPPPPVPRKKTQTGKTNVEQKASVSGGSKSSKSKPQAPNLTPTVNPHLANYWYEALWQ